LKAAQAAVNTISNNIANSATEGYTRKILPQQTLVGQSGEGLGVTIGEITRKVDSALIRDIFNQTSVAEGVAVKEGYLARIQQFHGPSEAEISISAEIAHLNDSFVALTAAPDDPIALNSVLGKALGAAEKFNKLGDLITGMRNETQDEIRQAVENVNALLGRIDELNTDIAGFSSSGRSFANLEDHRDAAITELSTYISVKFFKTEDNRVVVLTQGAEALVDDDVHNLIFNPTPLGAGSSLGNGGSASLSLDRNGFLGDADLTQAPIGGKLGGLLELRDQTLVKYQAQADELA